MHIAAEFLSLLSWLHGETKERNEREPMSPLPDEDARAQAGVFPAGDGMREIDLDTVIARRTPP